MFKCWQMRLINWYGIKYEYSSQNLKVTLKDMETRNFKTIVLI